MKQYKPPTEIWITWNLKSGSYKIWFHEPDLHPGEYENDWRKVKYIGKITRKKK